MEGRADGSVLVEGRRLGQPRQLVLVPGEPGIRGIFPVKPETLRLRLRVTFIYGCFPEQLPIIFPLWEAL